MKVAVVGCGHLGSRHAQALAKHPGLEAMSLVEPSSKALEIAVDRVRQSGFLGPVETHSSVLDLEGSFRLTVLSTSSKDRAETLRRILSTVRSEYILLEKLLAPNLVGLGEISTYFEDSRDQFWVNCPMPYFPQYEEMWETIQIEKEKHPVGYKVIVSDSGLVTNSIHYLDHFYRITNRSVSSPSFDSESQLIYSKRPGYSEVAGSFTSQTDFGDHLTVRFLSPARNLVQKTTITCGSYSWEFDETQQSSRQFRDGAMVSAATFQTPLQSDLTQRSLERLEQGEPPHWSDIETSLSLHRKLFDGLARFQRDGNPFLFT